MKKLSPTDVKRLSIHMYSHVAQEVSNTINQIEESKRNSQGVENCVVLMGNHEGTPTVISKMPPWSSITDRLSLSQASPLQKFQECMVMGSKDSSPRVSVAYQKVIPPPPPPPSPLTTRSNTITSFPPTPPTPPPVTSTNTKTPTLPPLLPPPPMNLSSTKTPQQPPPPPPPPPISTIHTMTPQQPPPPPPPTSMASGNATTMGIPPPSPAPGKQGPPPPPLAPMTSKSIPPPPFQQGKGGAPPPHLPAIGGTPSLRAKATTKLKRLSQMGS